MRTELFITEKNLFNKNYTDNDITLIIALNGLMIDDNRTDFCLNLSVLTYAVFGDELNHTKKELVRRHFKNLCEKEIVKIKKQLDKSTFICDISKLYVHTTVNNWENNYYVCISKKELHTLMNVNEDIDCFKLVRLYLCYINSLHKGDSLLDKYKGRIGFMPQSYLVQKAYTCDKTVYKYNKILEQYNLLYIVRHKVHTKICDSKGEGKLIKTTNTYSRFTDKELCDEYVKYYKSNYYSAEEYKECIFKKEYSQKSKHLLSGKDYSIEELYKMYDYAVAHNDDVILGIIDGKEIDEDEILERIKTLEKEIVSTNNSTIIDYNTVDSIDEYFEYMSEEYGNEVNWYE